MMDAFTTIRSGAGYLEYVFDRIYDWKEVTARKIIDICFPAWVKPDHLTYARFVISGVIICILVDPRLPDFNVSYLNLLFFFLFTIAALTDLFDGPLARMRKIVTQRGAELDPLADKLLVIPLLWYYLWNYSPELVICVTVGEVLAQTLRFIGFRIGKDMSSNVLGKYKMVAQTVGVYLIFFRLNTFSVALLWIAFGIGFGSVIIQAHRLYPRFFRI
ncbi:CDP-alcohol phosphatidyltransferase family protein [Patescibacteria group bacterium]